MMPSVLPPHLAQHQEADSLLFSMLLGDTPLGECSRGRR